MDKLKDFQFTRSIVLYGMNIEYKFVEYEKKILDIIIPLRMSDSYNYIKRLEFLKFIADSRISITIVDDGSSDNYSNIIQEFCKKNYINYIKVNSQFTMYSGSRARNIGAMLSLCKYILFKDFDVLIDKNFIDNLLHEIDIFSINNYNNEFFVFPVLFLTEDGNHYIEKKDINLKISYAISAFLKNDNQKIQYYGPGFGALLFVNKYHFLAIGGMDEQYTGWGCEDLDLFYRLILESNLLTKPTDIVIFDKLSQVHEKKNYEGFRSYLYVLSEYFSRKGMYGIHFYHAKPQVEDTWYSSKLARFNEERLLNKLSFKKVNSSPLPAIEYGKTLIIDKHPYSLSREIMPFYGVVDIHSVDFFDATDILTYVKNNNVNRIIFVGPYGSEKKKNLFHLIKNKIEFAVIERGALPDSIYVDETGFCCESKKYNSLEWDIDYDENYTLIVKNYIKNYFSSTNSLEKQSNRIGSTELIKKLGIPQDKKILFVPLQSEYDVTMKFFCLSIGGYNGFISLIRKLAYSLPNDWVMIVKNHPLTDKKVKIPNAIMSDDNIDDLLSASNMVLLINSGVGVLSMLHFKPVLYMGDTFYACDDINRKVSNIEEILLYLGKGFSLNEDKVYKFIYYLITKFYCFGKSETERVMAKNNSFITRTKNIKMNKIIVPWSSDIFINKEYSPINTSSILYSKYDFSEKKTILENSMNDKNLLKYAYIDKETSKMESKTGNNHKLYKNYKAYRLYKKLITKPYQFFNDSKFLKPLRIFFKCN